MWEEKTSKKFFENYLETASLIYITRTTTIIYSPRCNNNAATAKTVQLIQCFSNYGLEMRFLKAFGGYLYTSNYIHDTYTCILLYLCVTLYVKKTYRYCFGSQLTYIASDVSNLLHVAIKGSLYTSTSRKWQSHHFDKSNKLGTILIGVMC